MDISLWKQRIAERQATIGVVGMGYVGLPLLLEFCRKGFKGLGFDILPERCRQLKDGRSYIAHIPDASIRSQVEAGRLDATSDFARVAEADALLICVPTPLTRHREPDLSFIVKTAESIAPHLKTGCLVVLESTTYPGTTAEDLVPILERHGRKVGKDLFVAFSPEREDPGREGHSAPVIPKVVGADDPVSREMAECLYSQVVVKVVPVQGTRTAEAVKLTENIFRSVNIALVNELKVIFTQMGVDVWEVIEAAKTKPFGFMPFYPGPGLGGHCIPIDPFYLTWKAREYDCNTKFIELAGEINSSMPRYVIERLTRALNDRGKPLRGSRILILGMAYKSDVDDDRESPSYQLFELLLAGGAQVAYYDPYIPVIKPSRQHAKLAGRKSIEWAPDLLESFDAALIATAHSQVDYAAVVRHSKLVVDSRNATRNVVEGREKIVMA
ncbi:MAG: nucleotide sugar dehydrogenase [Candidatus Sumerlaeota bacterium]|nr:nucleotide sugar dehydrogenase [Candidatus Sumerlaeota bacterium]